MTSTDNSGYSVEVGQLTGAITTYAGYDSRLAAARRALEATSDLQVWTLTEEVFKALPAYLHPSPGPTAAAYEQLYPDVLHAGLALLDEFRDYLRYVDNGLRQVATTYLGSEEETKARLAACD